MIFSNRHRGALFHGLFFIFAPSMALWIINQPNLAMYNLTEESLPITSFILISILLSGISISLITLTYIFFGGKKTMLIMPGKRAWMVYFINSFILACLLSVIAIIVLDFMPGLISQKYFIINFSFCVGFVVPVTMISYWWLLHDTTITPM